MSSKPSAASGSARTAPAFQPLPLPLDERLAQHIVKEVQTAMREMFLTHSMPGAVRFDCEPSVKGDISGIVGIFQDRMEGTVSCSFEREAIFLLLSKVYGRSFTRLEKPVREGVGEITNIVYCLIKKFLNERGHGLKMAIPSVVLGSSHTIYNLHTDGRSLSIPFEVPGGRILIQITVQPA